MGRKEGSDLSECIIRWALKVKWQKMACQPELVEDSCAEALPTMLRQAQHDTHLLSSC
jgi:hypothetical protein